VPVVETVGVKATGVRALVKVLDAVIPAPRRAAGVAHADGGGHRTIRPRCAAFWGCRRRPLDGVTFSDRVDAVVLHPVLGPLILA
jgi:hypothetical protein